ncbi:hypothetical protein [Cytobacillus sp. Bac17]|uniref:hypothetical protein n=1 Tax=Cytobacillus sp. Bac17 TaxID=2926008 RepID=UPI0021184E95|nr:hypothetical protein [Cytobacillus sp. Bac17]
MSKTGFLVKVSSKGREYFYLRKSERLKENKAVKRDRNIYSFGTRSKAIENLQDWQRDIEKMPNDLKILGYDREDVLSWIEQIENK